MNVVKNIDLEYKIVSYTNFEIKMDFGVCVGSRLYVTFSPN